MTEGSRLARLRAVVGLAVDRTLARATGTETRQTALSIFGVAVSVGLVLLVTSVSLGLATGGLASSDVDYWVVPEGSASSAVTPVQGQRLGQVHRGAERMANVEGVTDATPVLATLVRANRSDGDGTEYLLAVGVVPNEGGGSVAGIPTDALTPGDPHYADGGYDGPWTGEAVLSAGAAEVLGLETGETLDLASGARSTDRSFEVTAAETARGGGIGQLPVFVVHLSELQVVTGAAGTDSADRILVRADARTPAVERALERVYPRTDVLSPSERLRQQALSAELPLAVAAASLLVSVLVGTLFLVTTLGFELAEDATNRAVMAAVGLSGRTLAVLVAVQTLTITAVGGLAGILLWGAAVLAVNGVAGAVYATSVAQFHPLLPVYGLAVALCIGFLSVPALLVVERRTTTDPDRVGV